jgi:hypothetical protein
MVEMLGMSAPRSSGQGSGLDSVIVRHPVVDPLVQLLGSDVDVDDRGLFV